MINSKIIKIASITNNVGLRNKFTHKSSIKNSLCGDFIRTEFIADKSKIKSMRYETESCVLCEASASLLSRKIKNIKILDLTKEIKQLKKFKRNKVFKFPKKLKDFNELINKKSLNRLNCVILPMEAFLKAFKVDK
tara:strand:+ start:385 stop:792 length:408 start_codon:yes stop_codon:yes gene_type:complete